MSILYRINELIEKKGISKEQLARDAGIDIESLDISLKSNIPFKGAVVLLKLAKYFRVSIYWLISGESENKETEKRLKNLLEDNTNLLKEVKELKQFISDLAPCRYDDYLDVG